MAFESERLSLAVAPPARAARRDSLFRESLAERFERWALGYAWGLAPKRIGGVPNLIKLCFDEFLAPDYALPDPTRALANPSGLAGIVHDLTTPTLLAAFRRGLYPLAHVAPMKWWSPPQRSPWWRPFRCSAPLCLSGLPRSESAYGIPRRRAGWALAPVPSRRSRCVPRRSRTGCIWSSRPSTESAVAAAG